METNNNLPQQDTVSHESESPLISPVLKNNKSKTVIIILPVIVVLLVAIGAVYAFKNGVFSKDAETVKVAFDGKIYEHSSGLYSISYPSDWTVSLTNLGVVFSDLGKKEQIGFTQNYTNLDREFGLYIVDEDPSGQYQSGIASEKKIEISGINSKQVNSKNSTSYIVPLDNGKFLVVSAVVKDGSDDWLPLSHAVVQTLNINSNVEITDSQTNNVQDDIALKNLVASTRPAVELYLDSHPDYSGFCNTQEEPAYSVLLQIKEKAGNRPFLCTDGDSFALSVQLNSGEYYCADNTYFSGVISSLHTSGSCGQENVKEPKQPSASDGLLPPAIPTSPARP